MGKILAQGSLSATRSVLYTPPIGGSALVSLVRLVNTSGSGAVTSVKIRSSDGLETLLTPNDWTFNAGHSADLVDEGELQLDSGDSIVGYATISPENIAYLISGEEIAP